jgi:myosin heavy subunit
VAVNPYKTLDIFTLDYVKKYAPKGLVKSAPHIFATAHLASHLLREERTNQSILISGESGSGKDVNPENLLIFRYIIGEMDKYFRKN